MDIDRYIADNEAMWRELADATRRTGRRRGLDADGIDRLVALYQRTSSQLSHVRAAYDDPTLTGRLTTLVADARAVIYGARPRSWRTFVDTLTFAFPNAVWRSRWFVAASAALFFVPALIFGVWLATSEVALDTALPPEARDVYIEEDFEDYYSSAPAAAFSTQVLLNNIQVSFLAFAGGIVVGLGTIVVLVTNGAQVGLVAGAFHHVGEPGRFWGLITPHGLLELSAIVVAGAAGLRLGWSIISPGDRTRAQALADEARGAVTIVLGLMGAFVVAGLIEGFVTPSSLPTAARVATGAAVEAAFVAYIAVFGPRQAPDRTATAAVFPPITARAPEGAPDTVTASRVP